MVLFSSSEKTQLVHFSQGTFFLSLEDALNTLFPFLFPFCTSWLSKLKQPKK